MDNSNVLGPGFRERDQLVKDNARLGIFFLIPPTLLWGLIIVFIFDATLAQYTIARINLNSLDMIFLIAGMISPGAALVVGIHGLLQKDDIKINLSIVLLSSILLILMALNLFIY